MKYEARELATYRFETTENTGPMYQPNGVASKSLIWPEDLNQPCLLALCNLSAPYI